MSDKEIETFFTVVVHTDGTLSVALDNPETPIQAKREATNGDVFAVSKQIVQELEQGQLVERIVTTLLGVLTPPAEETVPEKVKSKLKERGIDADTTASAE
jgi:hypothetical protein